MADDQDPATTPEAGQAPTAPETPPDAPQESASETPAVTRTTRRSPRTSAAKKSAPAADADAAPATATSTEGATDDAPEAAPAKKTTRKAPAKKAAATRAPAKKAAAKKAPARKAAAKKSAPAPAEEAAPAPAEETPVVPADPAQEASSEPAEAVVETPAEEPAAATVPLFQAPVTAAPVKRPRKRTTTTVSGVTTPQETPTEQAPAQQAAAPEATPEETGLKDTPATAESELATDAPVAEPEEAPAAETAPVDGEPGSAEQTGTGASGSAPTAETTGPDSSEDSSDDAEGEGGDGSGRRRRRRGGRRRRKGGGDGQHQGGQDGASEPDGRDEDSSSVAEDQEATGEEPGSGPQRGRRAARAEDDADETTAEDGSSGTDDAATSEGRDAENGDGEQSGSSRRRRRRRREGDDGGGTKDDPSNTVTRVRKQRSAEDEITAVSGSTRLEAKKQRRREGREAGRRRAPIVSEAEFLARREAVERTMVIRQREELTQIAVLEDKVLVEHYVARESQTSLIGNVYVGRVQNVLPSMEAAFIDIGKGRNAVLYAGEVNWQALGHKDGAPRKIESVLSSGQPILVQVTKDPVGHKGARLTSQVSLAGRFLVYVPDGTTNGISRKLADTERTRLKSLLKEIVPDSAGVIVRTAAEGASEEELTRDVERLKARWEDIEAKTSKGTAPQLLYGEPDLTLKVVRDLFTEDFTSLVIQGDDAWNTVQGYVAHVAPDLQERLRRDDSDVDVFTTYRVDEQIAKGLDRKVWLPSGGSLVIDRTEAMTVVDVNTGKFTGSGGNLEETVTKNNLEAAEEIVRQLRLRDVGGIIVVDFIDMVLESNRDLVLRRLVECLGRDRTRHQVAEVTSLGLVQMTRKRIGTGLLEAFSHGCEACQGRGVTVQERPVEPRHGDDEPRGKGGRRSRGGRSGQDDSSSNGPSPQPRQAKQGGADKQEQSERGGSKSDRGRGSGREQDQAQEQPSEAAGETTGRAPSPAEFAAMARADRPAEGGAPATEAPATEAPATEAPGDDASSAAAPTATDPAVSPGETSPADAPSSAPTASDPAGAGEPEAAKGEPVPQASEAQEPAHSSGTPAPADAAPSAEESQEAPRVVSRTRRRSATRPAGEPVGTAAPAPVVVDAGTSEASSDAPPLEQPEAPATTPRVITRTRGRGGRRAASSTTPADGEGDAQ